LGHEWGIPSGETGAGRVGHVRAGFPRGIAPLRRPVWDALTIRCRAPPRQRSRSGRRGTRWRAVLCGQSGGSSRSRWWPRSRRAFSRATRQPVRLAFRRPPVTTRRVLPLRTPLARPDDWIRFSSPAPRSRTSRRSERSTASPSRGRTSSASHEHDADRPERSPTPCAPQSLPSHRVAESRKRSFERLTHICAVPIVGRVSSDPPSSLRASEVAGAIRERRNSAAAGPAR
jgi:hypothetical protein